MFISKKDNTDIPTPLKLKNSMSPIFLRPLVCPSYSHIPSISPEVTSILRFVRIAPFLLFMSATPLFLSLNNILFNMD